MIRALLLGMLLGMLVLAAGCGDRNAVILYTSQDQFYAEPILKSFSRESGKTVRALFDTESAKTAALAHRLRAERSNPQCHVFWNNEEMHTRLLVRDGIIATNEWWPVGYRARRLVINTNRVPLAQAPKSLLELTNANWSGKVAIASPLFGTTSYHFLALRQHWGDEVWRQWCVGLMRNATKVVDGNSVVVRLVGSGEAWIGLTDSDDINAGLKSGLPIASADLASEGLSIPNTVALIRNRRPNAMAEILVSYLSRPETLRMLVEAGAIEGTDYHNSSTNSIRVDWESPLTDLDQMNEFLKTVFLRS